MERGSKATATVAVIVIAVLLLFSWQYIGDGNGDGSSPMEGTWMEAGTATKYVSDSGPVGSGDPDPTYEVTREGSILTMVHGDGSHRFAMISDTEAVSLSVSVSSQLYFHGSTLFLITYYAYNGPDMDSVSVSATMLTADGEEDPSEDLTSLKGLSFAVNADAFTSTGDSAPSLEVSVTVTEQRYRALSLDVSLEGLSMEGVGFCRTDGDRLSIFGVTLEGMIFNAVIDGDDVTLTGRCNYDERRYLVNDPNGELKEDRIGFGKGVSIVLGTHVVAPDTEYAGGIAIAVDDEQRAVMGFYVPSIGGQGYVMVDQWSAIVPVDGALDYIRYRDPVWV